MWTKNNTIDDLIEGLIKHGPDNLDLCITDSDIQKYVTRVHHECLGYPIPPQFIDSTNWFIPNEYKNMDIEKWLLDKCPKENQDRLIKELTLYKEQGFVPVLKAMKYIVDTLRSNNVVWGVGRGSSVASYVLYLIGVHKIDSIKYNIPIEEFFKGE